MKACIIKRYYQSPRDASINQTTYLTMYYGGDRIKGDFDADVKHAFVFDRKSWAKAIIKGMNLDDLSIVEITTFK
jgi:hypothetical protein